MGSQEGMASLEARVAAIEARQEIVNVLSAYSLAAALRDEPRWVEQFADDATLEITVPSDVPGAPPTREVVTGRAALGGYFRGHIAVGRITHQQVHNEYIQVHGGTADAQSFYTSVRHDKDGGTTPRAGFYYDELVVTPRGWKIKRRSIVSL